jgi:hypothetical protein
MTFNSRCPHCNEVHDYALDLQTVLGRLRMPDYATPVKVRDLTVKMYPQPYFDLNEGNMLQYEEQKLIQAIQNTEMDAELRSVEINKQVERIVELNNKTLTASTQYIELADGTKVSDKKHISEFYANSGGAVTKQVQEKLTQLATDGAVQPLTVNCEACTKQFDIQVTFDYASFFDNGF